MIVMSDPVLSSVIAASVAIIGLIVSKEGKTSEFRQQWIDSLRQDLSTLIANTLHRAEDEIQDEADAVKVCNEAVARIRLRLNPREKNSQQLLGCVTKMAALNGVSTASHEELRRAANGVVAASQVVLKQEWSRVKRGEWRYVTVLIIAVSSLGIGLWKMFVPALPFLHR